MLKRRRGKFQRFLRRWEKKEDRWAKMPWSNLCVWVYGIVWLIVEKGNIGWDGWATLAALEIALSIRHRQGKL